MGKTNKDTKGLMGKKKKNPDRKRKREKSFRDVFAP